MLTYADRPTIRNAIIKRLGDEREVRIVSIPIKKGTDCVRVGVLLLVGDAVLVRSVFELPEEFDHAHLVNEIDEIAEQCKAARVDYLRNGCVVADGEKDLGGTGLRGRWASKRND